MALGDSDHDDVHSMSESEPAAHVKTAFSMP